MKKMLFGSVLALMLTFGFGAYYLLSNFDGFVKVAIESYGSQATHTVVQVESVRIGLKDGSGVIHGLTIGNPPGFTAQQAFSLGEITTQIDLKSIKEEVTVIEQITVRAPAIFFELNAAGKNNLEELKRNLSSGASEASTSSSGQSSAAEPKQIIRKLLFVDGNIYARVVPLNKDYELKMPKIELQNLGGKNGATPTRIAEQILTVLAEKALVEVRKKGLDQFKEKLEGKLKQSLDADKEKLGDKLKEVFKY